MGHTFRYYTILRPLRDSYVDDGSSVLALVPAHINSQTVEVALIGTPTDPRMIRISVSGIDKDPSADERKQFDDLAESMLALLRIWHDNEISFAQPMFRYGNMIEDGLPPALNIGLTKDTNTYNLDCGFAASFMQSDKEFKDILRLYADALHPYSPVQYRYLSAYKVIEHEFKRSRKKWKPELDTLLTFFEASYRALNVSPMSLKSFIFDLRDKCAHIKVGDADLLTIVGVASLDTEKVIRFLPLFLEIIKKHVFDAYKSDGTAFRAVHLIAILNERGANR